jgi:glycosyltransferase involved in cell wall biosynthesis
MKFSLVHPSRGRAALAEATAREWAARRSPAHTHEHILSVDTTDPAQHDYERVAARLGLRLTANPNRTMVEATNRGLALAEGDVIVVVSDDFSCPEGWDVALAGVIDGRPRAAVLVHDGGSARIMTLPVLTCAYANELGFLYHPAYRSMYADDDLTEVARRDGVLIDARHIVFLHRHHSAGLSEADEVSAVQGSLGAWWHGWRVFQKRRLDGFGARRRTLAVRIAQARVELYYRVRVAGAAARRWWLPRLGGSLRAAEARARLVALRMLRVVTNARGTEV